LKIRLHEARDLSKGKVAKILKDLGLRTKDLEGV
jgi:hypothetical protein